MRQPTRFGSQQSSALALALLGGVLGAPWAGGGSRICSVPSMTDIDRRPNRTPRRAREQRAYQLVLATGGASVVAVVTAILAIFSIGSFGFTFVALVVAAVCGFLLKRAVGR